jgi:hypothetical protein
MKPLFYSTLAGFALFFSFHTAHAELAAPTFEINGQTNAAFLSQAFSDGSDSEPTLMLDVGLKYFQTNQWELGGNIYFQSNTDTKVFQTTVGPTYNFIPEVEHSFFLSAQIGLRNTKLPSSRTYTPFAYRFGFGKRFQIAEHVCWMPELVYTGRTAGTNENYTLGATQILEIIPIQISVIF